MKKLIYTLFALIAVAGVKSQNSCCPEFTLTTNIQECNTRDGNVKDDGKSDPKGKVIIGCKNSVQDYYVMPDMPGFNFTWVVTGGEASASSGNPNKITWGDNPQGNKIVVYIESEDGLCRDTLSYFVELRDAPIADFEFSPESPVCRNQLITFTNTSVGATSYYWDFGDGNSSTQTNPTHSYSEPGIYTVTLVTYRKPIPEKPDAQPSESERECGCTNEISYTIEVLDADALSIESSCKVMLCEGDTATYYTNDICQTYNWSVTGGTILGAANGKEIVVVWNGSYPATVSLDADCNSPCSNHATIQVPVLYNTMDIDGAIKVCQNSMHTYELPSMPGTFYQWSVDGPNNIIGYSSNTSSVNIHWGYSVGSYTINVEYQNPHTGCSGSASLEVNVTPPFQIYGPVTACVDSPFNFSASGDASWTISPNSGFTPSAFPSGTSISGTWTQIGDYIVEATSLDPDSYCNETVQMKVKVMEKPVIDSIAGVKTICPGGTSVFSVSSNVSEGHFAWTVFQGNVVSYMGARNDSVSVEWGNSGPYSIQVVQYANGCQSEPYVLNLDAAEAPDIIGSDVTCMDETEIYTTSVPAPLGGYEWSLSNALGTIVSGQGTDSIEIMWHGSTSDNTINLTLTTCGGTVTKNITVNIAPPLTISKSGSVCDPNGVSLTASIAGASAYRWYRNNSLMTENTQTISVTLAGKYKVEVDDVNGCVSRATYVVHEERINISATISTTDEYIWGCEDDVNTTLHAIPASSEYCYQWYRSNHAGQKGSAIAGATLSSYTATSPGFYWVEISICNTSCLELAGPFEVIKLECGDGCEDDFEADFTFTDCSPISFSASTVPADAIRGATWFFGDGHRGDGINVTHQYTDTAVYKVCAIIYTDSCFKKICKDVEINLAANFSASADCNEVTFTNLSKSRYPIATYNWSFPGATPSSSNLQTPPVVTYASGGLHTVTLTVDDGTCTVVYQDTIRTWGATAEMQIPDPLCVGTDAPFTAISNVPDQTYQWDFGDGYLSNLQNTTHAYQNAGSYTVTLTVTGITGCTSVYTQDVTVTSAPDVHIGNDLWLCPGDSVIISAPAGFDNFQWYRNGELIDGATNQTYAAQTHGEYWVLAGDGEGCKSLSNHINVFLHQSPIASIVGQKQVCTNDAQIYVYNAVNQPGYQYNWSITGPESGVFQYGNTNNYAVINLPNKTVGNYEVVLTVTDQNSGCVASDTLCVFVSESPVLTVEVPDGDWCEGEIYTFVAHAEPSIAPLDYTYIWSTGFVGDTLRTGKPGMISVTAISPYGCTATQYLGSIKALPNVSLAPLGCDTLCLTDTIWLPLPEPNYMGYNVTWYDDTGTEIINVGTGAMLPLASLHPGIHHLFAEVGFPGSCSTTTGKYDVYVEDCTLPTACDNCIDLLESAEVERVNYTETDGQSTILNYNFTFTIAKEVQEVRISLSDLQYAWSDSLCVDCDIQALERGCIFPVDAQIGSLTWYDYTSSGKSSEAGSGDCPQELIWKGETPLMPGTYTVPIQVTVSAAAAEDCKIYVEKTCFQLTLIDTDCLSCESIICVEDTVPYVPGSGPEDDCGCSASGEWTSLYLIPQKPGIPKPKTPILCNTVLENIVAGTNYVLSGVYHCFGECVSVKNEIVVYNQQNQIIYTRESAHLNEVITFPTAGVYEIVLTATCGTEKCVCRFRINVVDSPGDIPEDGDEPTDTPDDTPTDGGVTIPADLPGKIDEFVKETIPGDFNGSILVAKNDSVIYEKYVSYKDEVNEHTAFDIASVTKPFTAAAILKLMEEGKLNLDDPVSKYLPIFPFSEITVRMLLTHRSGLMDYLRFIDESGWNKSINVTNNDLLNILAENKNKVLINKPGAVYQYSNTNYSLLALIIEKVSGTSYANYLDLNFFMPLGLKDTYVVDVNNFARATPSYYRNGTIYKLRYLDLVYGDKCVYSTTQDLRKWDTALRNGKVLKQSTLDEVYRTVGQGIAFNSSYTMGWKKIIASNGKEFLYHDGWWAGNRALLIRLIEEDVVIAVLSNNNFTTIKEIRKMVDLFGDYQMSTKPVPNF